MNRYWMTVVCILMGVRGDWCGEGLPGRRVGSAVSSSFSVLVIVYWWHRLCWVLTMEVLAGSFTWKRPTRTEQQFLIIFFLDVLYVPMPYVKWKKMILIFDFEVTRPASRHSRHMAPECPQQYYSCLSMSCRYTLLRLPCVPPVGRETRSRVPTGTRFTHFTYPHPLSSLNLR